MYKFVKICLVLILMILISSCEKITTKSTNSKQSKNVINVKFYSWVSLGSNIDEDMLSYKLESVSIENLSKDTIKFMNYNNGIQLNEVWYDNNKIYVDLNSSEIFKFDKGTAASFIRKNILLKTFSSYPNVKEIEILIDGKKGYIGEHYSFDKIFQVNKNEGIENKPITPKISNVKFYYIDNTIKYKSESILSEKLSTETIKFMNLYNNIKINNIWYENNRICIDLNSAEVSEFNKSLSKSSIRKNILLKTFSSYPNVKEIEVLIDGKQNFVGEYFMFDKIFEVISFKDNN